MIIAGQEPSESLTRGSGLMLQPAWHLLPVRPFLSKTHESTLIFLQGHMFLHAPTGHHSGGIIGNIFILFGHPGDFQLLSFLSQLPLPQSPPGGRKLSQCPLWTQGLASCQHTQLLLSSLGKHQAVAWQNLRETEASDTRSLGVGTSTGIKGVQVSREHLPPAP